MKTTIIYTLFITNYYYYDYLQIIYTAKPEMPSDAPVVTDLTEETVSLSWKPSPSDSVTYTIQNKILDGDWQTVQENISDTKATVPTDPSKENLYRVIAKNEFGESKPTKEATVSKRAGPPEAMTKPTCEKRGLDGALVSWTPAKNTDGFVDIPITYTVEKRYEYSKLVQGEFFTLREIFCLRHTEISYELFQLYIVSKPIFQRQKLQNHTVDSDLCLSFSVSMVPINGKLRQRTSAIQITK